jgi:hypothetical protein
LGCQHCQGVLAFCSFLGFDIFCNQALTLELASVSAGSGSRYGQYTLALLHRRAEENFKGMSPKPLRYISWLQRKALMPHSASWAKDSFLAVSLL